MAIGRQNGDVRAIAGGLSVAVVVAGPTDWDETERLGGRADMPLCGQGFELARTHANSLGRVSLVVSGPDEASRETGRLIAGTEAKLRHEDELAEMNVGLWEGVRRSELLGRCPKVCRGWEADGHAFTPPEGESFGEVTERVGRCMERLIGKVKADGLVIVVRPIVASVVRAWLATERGESATANPCGWDAEVFRTPHRVTIPWRGTRRGVGGMVGGVVGSLGGLMGGVMGFGAGEGVGK